MGKLREKFLEVSGSSEIWGWKSELANSRGKRLIRRRARARRGIRNNQTHTSRGSLDSSKLPPPGGAVDPTSNQAEQSAPGHHAEHIDENHESRYRQSRTHTEQRNGDGG